LIFPVVWNTMGFVAKLGFTRRGKYMLKKLGILWLLVIGYWGFVCMNTILWIGPVMREIGGGGPGTSSA